ncbi:hypothetical protein BB559_004368 [Furculomyces boomerangus]|uniref:Sas10 C-terminal domain-containing protein n=1 Tax=Furculomyces boomerangus TaxID=61424 RepID=A0A2T9YF80_9FUNG|nr:hypothetical protein BB559_004368 [Furculomyces boomerangus]
MAKSKKSKSGARTDRNPKNGINDGTTAFDKTKEFERRGTQKKIMTWNDVEHDSEDEYFEERDKILLDDTNQHPRDEINEDVEVFGLGDEDSSSQSTSEASDSDKDGYYSQEDNKDEESDGEQDKDGAWGAKKKSYYDSGEILASSDEEAAEMEEETEALRLQKRYISSLSVNDFIEDVPLSINNMDLSSSKQLLSTVNEKFDLDDFDFTSTNKAQDGEVPEDLEEFKRIEKLNPSEKKKLIARKHPELVGLLKELQNSSKKASFCKSLLDKAYDQVAETNKNKNFKFISEELVLIESIYQLSLLNVSNIAFYLMAITSKPNEKNFIGNIQQHSVFSVLSKTIDKLDVLSKYEPQLFHSLETKLDSLNSQKDMHTNNETKSEIDFKEYDYKKMLNLDDIDSNEDLEVQPKRKQKNKSKNKLEMENNVSENIHIAEQEFHELMNKYSKHPSSKKTRSNTNLGTNSGDFGEQVSLENSDILDKEISTKKMATLRHYASKVVSGKNKKEKKLLLAGDVDIPYREPKSREEKLVEIKRRPDEKPDIMDGLSDGSDNDSDNNGDEYYEKVKKDAENKKLLKKSKKDDAWKAVLESNLEQEEYEMDVDSNKRPINYQILKNKGLTPKRQKVNRNPRVKKKVKYAAAKKKLASTKRIYKVPTKGYGGEATGIKKNLAKSTKLG